VGGDLKFFFGEFVFARLFWKTAGRIQSSTAAGVSADDQGADEMRDRVAVCRGRLAPTRNVEFFIEARLPAMTLFQIANAW
jgi:hypothetical protein